MFRTFIVWLAVAVPAAAIAQQEHERHEAAQVQEQAPVGPSHSLSPGATAQLGEGVDVTLERVDDSRCPAGMMCTRKGDIVYHFTLRTGERSERFTLSSDAPRYSSAALAGATLALDPGRTPEPEAERGHAPAPEPAHSIRLQLIRR